MTWPKKISKSKFLKMKTQVNIISKNCIKPSSPTPPHLKTYNISLLDQFLAPDQVPMILFYSNQDPILPNKDEIISKRSLLLKQSLSETLTHFYPLAGKMKTSLSVECNDEGVLYVEARANISLFEYLTKHDVTSQNGNLLPRQVGFSALAHPITMIQETTFACGSLAIGALGLHTVMDGTAMASLLKAWAAIAARKSPVSVNFNGPSIFPQHDQFPKDAVMVPYLLRTGKPAIARIVFKSSDIASLKSQASSSMRNPTRVEVVSAFLGERIMASLKARSKIDRPVLLTHAVNLRQRALPPFPERSLGNILWVAPTILSSHKETKLISLACKMREAIRKIDDNFVKNIQGDGGFLMLYDNIKEIGKAVKSGADHLVFTSWCNFGLYDADFGWGRPSWVAVAGLSSSGDSPMPILNTVILMDSKMEKGIEAWVTLDEEEISLLEKDKELLAYACVNPCPLKL